jgi:hypothetical protein
MKVIAFVVQASEVNKILAQGCCRRNRRKFTQREGHRKVIDGKPRLLANGERMQRIQKQSIKISRYTGSTGKDS